VKVTWRRLDVGSTRFAEPTLVGLSMLFRCLADAVFDAWPIAFARAIESEAN